VNNHRKLLHQHREEGKKKRIWDPAFDLLEVVQDCTKYTSDSQISKDRVNILFVARYLESLQKAKCNSKEGYKQGWL
jgi:hypothetical protein